MAHREYVDSEGVAWQVWEVVPERASRPSRRLVE